MRAWPQESCTGGSCREYDLRRLFRMPDILCLGWRNTAATRAFACAWGLRVATLSMREQLSFDIARPRELNLTFGKPPHFGSFRSTDANRGCLEAAGGPAST